MSRLASSFPPSLQDSQFLFKLMWYHVARRGTLELAILGPALILSLSTSAWQVGKLVQQRLYQIYHSGMRVFIFPASYPFPELSLECHGILLL